MLIQKSISGYFYKKIKNMIKFIGPVFTQNFLSLSGFFFLTQEGLRMHLLKNVEITEVQSERNYSESHCSIIILIYKIHLNFQ